MFEPRISLEVAGSGHVVPGSPVLSTSIEERLGLSPGSLEGVTGVRSRHYCGRETQIDLAREAALRALEEARLEPSAVDLVISASGIPYQTLPGTAPLLQRELGIADGAAAAYDINSTCLSFLTGLEHAARMIAAGQHSCALVVSSEIASRALPWKDQPDVAALFGDGAAAFVIVKAKDTNGAKVAAALTRTYPSAYAACEIAAGGTRFNFHTEFDKFAAHTLFRMDGKALFKVTLRHFEAFVEDLLARACWRKSDVDIVVPHQASPHALAHLATHIGFAPGKLVDLTRTYGNQIAASIPTAFDVARKSQMITTGTRALLLGTAAGVSFGGMALEF